MRGNREPKRTFLFISEMNLLQTLALLDNLQRQGLAANINAALANARQMHMAMIAQATPNLASPAPAPLPSPPSSRKRKADEEEEQPDADEVPEIKAQAAQKPDGKDAKISSSPKVTEACQFCKQQRIKCDTKWSVMNVKKTKFFLFFSLSLGRVRHVANADCNADPMRFRRLVGAQRLPRSSEFE
jgi:hypothetical protein